MAVVIVSGMSGTGRSTVRRALAARGHRVTDTDDPGWAHRAPPPGGGRDRRWDGSAEPLPRATGTHVVDAMARPRQVADAVEAALPGA